VWFPKQRQAEELLFLKKKKQKDFYPVSPSGQCRRHCPTDGSFLVLFFKKEQTFLLY
jgi:hypothetical protein